MRPTWGLVSAIGLIVFAPCVSAQTIVSSSYPSYSGGEPGYALLRAAFGSIFNAPDDAVADPVSTEINLSQTHPLAPSRLVDGGGLAVWRSGEVALGASNAGTDSVRLSVGGVARAPGGLLSARPDGLLAPDAQTFDVRYIHGWPSALRWAGSGYALDFTPHAGLGVSNLGGSAEAGAMVRLGADFGAGVARKLGLHQVDGASYGGRGRFYLYAAASGQAVGLNMTPGAPGLPRSSWSAESTGTLISDAQAGIGWRKGEMQASFGYVHREIKGQTYDSSSVNSGKISDSMVAFSLSIHP